jgi:hypothetical protein
MRYQINLDVKKNYPKSDKYMSTQPKDVHIFYLFFFIQPSYPEVTLKKLRKTIFCNILLVLDQNDILKEKKVLKFAQNWKNI